jgi:RES domain-containing protein
MNILMQEGTFYRIVIGCRRKEIHKPAENLIFGGRFTPPELSNTLYLSSSVQGCLEEIRFRIGGDLRKVKPLVLGTFQTRFSKILDLTDEAVVKVFLGDNHSKIFSSNSANYETTHRLAAAAVKRGFEGILYHSAVSPEHKNLAVFLDNLGPNSFIKKISIDKVNIGCQPLSGRSACSRSSESVWQKVYQVI